MGNSIADCNLPHGIEQNTNPNGSWKKRERIALLLLRSIYCVCLSVRLSLPPSLPSFLPLLKNQNQKRSDTTRLAKNHLPKTLSPAKNSPNAATPKLPSESQSPVQSNKKTPHINTGSDTQNSQFSLSPIQTHKQSTIVECTLFFPPPFFFFFFFWGGGNLPMGSMLLNFKTQILETLRNSLSCNKQTPQCNNKSSLSQT
jgi:hypothetical protein